MLLACCCSCSEDMRAEFAAAAEARKRAGEDEEGGPAKRSKAEPLSDEVMGVLNEVSVSSVLVPFLRATTVVR